MINVYKNNPTITDRYFKNYYEYTKFSEEENEKLEAINQTFLLMQDYLKDRMIIFANLFRKLSKKDFPYLSNFKIIGTIWFYKEDPRVFANFSGTLSEEERKMLDKWKEFHFVENWLLEYDSILNDFTPLSKALLQHENFDSMRHKTFSTCSFLSFLINQNQCITYRDLFDLDFFKDGFCTLIKVYVNYDEDDIFSYSDSEQVNYEKKILSERKFLYNKSFNWSKSNMSKFVELNKFCSENYNFMESELKKLKKSFIKIANKRIIESFGIWTNLHYNNTSKATDIADKYILSMIKRQLNNTEEELNIDHFNDLHMPFDDICITWNFEDIQNQLSEDQKLYKFNSYMRKTLLDGNIFSFNDIINMKNEDFCIRWVFDFLESINITKQGD